MSIGNTIKKLRNGKNLTQDELAKELNCKRQKIADWERDKSTPSATDLIMLSKKLDTTTDYILGLTSAKSKENKEIRFICDYTHLNEETVRVLHNWCNTSTIETLNFFLNGTVLLDFNSFTRKFVLYKAALKELINYKKQMVEGKIKYTYNADEIEKIIDESNTLNDNVLLAEFKIQKELDNLLDEYTQTEKETDKRYSKKYDYLMFELYSDYMRLTEVQK